MLDLPVAWLGAFGLVVGIHRPGPARPPGRRRSRPSPGWSPPAGPAAFRLPVRRHRAGRRRPAVPPDPGRPWRRWPPTSWPPPRSGVSPAGAGVGGAGGRGLGLAAAGAPRLPRPAALGVGFCFPFPPRPGGRGRWRGPGAGPRRRSGGARRGRARRARACHDDGVAVAVFPELGLTGYAVDDLFLQDALLDAVTRRSARSSRASADLLPVLVVGRAARARHPGPQLRRRHPPRRGPRRRAEVLPAQLPRVLRAPLVRARRRPARTTIGSAAGDVPFGPTCSSRATDVPGSSCTWRSARTCGCRCRRAPRRRWPAPPCWPTCPAARSRSPAPRTGGCWSARPVARCLAAYLYAAAGRASRRPTCPGTARR